MNNFLLILAGGGLGSYLRYFVAQWAADRFGPAFPFGTLFVNLGGCFLIGLIAGLPLGAGSLTPRMRLLFMTGFLGGLTTFSSYEYESFMLAHDGALPRALLNLGGSVVAGFIAVVAGFLLMRTLAQLVKS